MSFFTGLPLISATQISLWEECQRKWVFKYLEHVEVPKKPGADLGVEVQDEQIDPYLRDGRPFDFTKPKSAEIAVALVPMLPKPQTPGVRLRRKFMIPSPTGRFGYIGEFDIYAPTSLVLPVGMIPDPGRALLYDIKTTKDLRYAKGEEELAKDVQLNLYSMAIMFEEPEVNELDAVWGYVRTVRPHRAQRTHLRVLSPHVVEQFGRIDEIGSQVVTIRIANPKANELPPTGAYNRTPDGRSICEAYGGCPYRHKCNLSPAVHAAAVNMEAIQVNAGTPDFLSNLRIATGAPIPPAGPGFGQGPGNPGVQAPSTISLQTAPALPPAPFPAPPGFQWNGATFVPAALPPGPIPNPPVGALPVAGAVVVPQPWPGVDPATIAAAGATGYIAPPPAPVGVIPPAFSAPVPPPPPGSIMGAPINPPETNLPPAPPVGVTAPAPAAEEKKKPGRPAGSKNKTEGGTNVAVPFDLDAIGFPREAFAQALELWAANVRGGK